jgi:hypothetical protein
MGIPKFKINQTLKKDLSQLELSEEDLVSGDFPIEEIFKLKIDEKIHGFFWQYDLKDYAQQDTSFEDNTFIQKYGKTDWMNLFDHPFFQRRRPQILNKIETSNSQQYFILEQGQKMGPFTIAEVKEQVRLKKAILTDMISLDDGHTWGKIYNIIEFDRRNEAQSLLPHSPEKEVLSHSAPEVKSKINTKNSDATESIAGLAYIGKNRPPIIDAENSLNNEDKKKKAKLRVAFISLAFITMISIFTYMLSSDGTKNTNITGNQNVQRDIKNKTRAMNAKKVKSNNARKVSNEKLKAANVRKAQERKAARRNKIRNSTPFKSTKTYKKAASTRSKRFVEIKTRDDEYRNDSYDNAADPVEQDPVRRTLSKDTLNPEDEYNDAQDEEQYNEEEKEITEEDEEEELDNEPSY